MPRSRRKKRTYDSSGRQDGAQRTREAVIEAARAEFLGRGYAATTVAIIASGAGVSVETVYKVFGGKPGLVRAIYERSLAGRGPVPAPQRSDAMSASEADPRALVRRWGVLASEVAPLVSPILLLVRAAAATDADMAALLEASEAETLARMRRNAGVLAERGFLRTDVTVEKAADVMCAALSPANFEFLVVRRGWTPEQFGDFVASTLIGALL